MTDDRALLVWDERDLPEYRERDWRIDGPFTTDRGAVEALAELVRLKDGPRDAAYRAAKDAAWDAARSIVGGQ